MGCYGRCPAGEGSLGSCRETGELSYIHTHPRQRASHDTTAPCHGCSQYTEPRKDMSFIHIKSRVIIMIVFTPLHFTPAPIKPFQNKDTHHPDSHDIKLISSPTYNYKGHNITPRQATLHLEGRARPDILLSLVFCSNYNSDGGQRNKGLTEILRSISRTDRSSSPAIMAFLSAGSSAYLSQRSPSIAPLTGT